MSAPPGCVDQLRVVDLAEFPAHYPLECCICMENFTGAEEIVATECGHVFHKQCCREWLRQARSQTSKCTLTQTFGFSRTPQDNK